MVLICPHSYYCKPDYECPHKKPHTQDSSCCDNECWFFDDVFNGASCVFNGASCQPVDHEQVIQAKDEFGLWDTVREMSKKALTAWVAKGMDETIIAAFDRTHLK